MMLLNALEIVILKDPENDEGKEIRYDHNFDWDVIDFSDTFLKIKINFENPEELGTLHSKDYISVTFWASQFFKS